MLNKRRRRQTNSSSNPLRVLGIALIVDEKGSGARLVARYPTQPGHEEDYEADFLEDHGVEDANRIATDPVDDPNAEEGGEDDNLFFTLTSRQMAKLFRTKKALCNQPMTLRVNRTIFCCHAVLMNNDDDENSATATATDATEMGEQPLLTLFSVVVALAAPAREAIVPFGNFWDGSNGDGEGTKKHPVSVENVATALPTTHDDHLDLERYLRHVTKESDKKTTTANKVLSKEENIAKKKKTAAKVSSAFMAIRRVHISLARLCRALEREERRCAYVSSQSQDFFRIRNDRQKQWEALQGLQGGETTTNASGDHPPRKPRHVRHASFGAAAAAAGSTASGATPSLEQALQTLTVTHLIPQEQEQEQEILELILAASSSHHPRHHGNLVGDLVSVFHSLSRRDHADGSLDQQETGRDGHPPTPINLLCEQGSVVYINQHLAIPIEAAGVGIDVSDLRPSSGSTGPSTVHPYHTLLFPYASPSELLQTFQSSGSKAPQRLEQLLLTVNPQKSLAEIALAANLPLHTTMQLASFLVTNSAAVVSNVISSKSRLTCLNIELLPKLSLEFNQAFPGVQMFGVVSFLTTSKTLGETMSSLTNTTVAPPPLNHSDSFDMRGGENSSEEYDMAAWIQESLLSSQVYQRRLKTKMAASKRVVIGRHFSNSSNERKPDDSFHQTFLHIPPPPPPAPMGTTMEEGFLHQYQYQQHYQEQQQIRIKVLEELLYSIAIWLLSHGVITHLQEYVVMLASSTSNSTDPVSKNSNADNILFEELVELGYMNGNVSLQSLAWRLGMSRRTLRAWARRHNQVRVLWRVPLAVASGMPSSTSDIHNKEDNQEAGNKNKA